MPRRKKQPEQQSSQAAALPQPDPVELFLAAVRVGVSLPNACRVAGMDIMETRKRLKADKDFKEKVKTAKAMFEYTQLSILAASGQRNWQSAKWLLETRHPKRWGPKPPVATGGEQVQPLKVVSLQDDL